MFIIDRFEYIYAVCEDENKIMHNILREELPKDVKEGDCIERVNGKYTVNEEKTKLLRQKVEKLIEDMWK